ncbi:MAG: hypothetical protein V1918_01635 [Planctomycetota bacterium]
MTTKSFPVTKSLLIGAALFVFAGVMCSGRISLPLIARYLSGDGALEEGTVQRVREIHLLLLAAGGVLALLGLIHKGAKRSLAALASSPVARRTLLAGLLVLAAYMLFLPPYYAMSMLYDDPVRYAFSAYNMFEGRGYLINVNRHYYPAKDFVGFPLFILPFYAAFGPFPGNAIYATFACALPVLLMTYVICRRVFGTTTAFLSLLLLCSHHLFLGLGRVVRSEMLSCALLLSVMLLFMELIKRERLWPAGALLLGVDLGCCYSARPTLLAAVVALPAIFLACKGMRMTAKATALICAGGVPVVLSHMLFCNAVYGGPLRTGYYVWEVLDSPLSLRNIALNFTSRWIPPEPQNVIQMIERFLETTNGAYYASSLLGLGNLYSPAIFLFIIVGVAASFGNVDADDRPKRVIVLSFLSVIGLHIFFYMTVYWGHDARYLFVILPLLFSLAAFGMSRKLALVCEERITLPALACAALFSLVISGVLLSLYRGVTSPRTPPFQYEVCEAYGRLLPPDGCVISGIHPTLVDHYVQSGNERRFYPISKNAMYVGKKIRFVHDGSLGTLPLDPVQRHMDEVRGMLRSGKVVMVDDWCDPLHPGLFDAERSMLFAEFAPREVYRSGPFRIYRLFPR